MNREGEKKKNERQKKMILDNKLKSEQRRTKRIEFNEKEKVCYNCRQVGHRMSDCTQEKSDRLSGICFKCGSKEHILRNCSVKLENDNELPYAKCFICSKNGHLSRDCPQNEKGLYPNGGCCNMCGSVKHLKQDCPENKRKRPEHRKEKKNISLKLITDEKVSVDEDITFEEESVDVEPVVKKKKTKKVINF